MAGESVATDRISALPDDILAHLLSFLSTKEAVKTCVLAKRWEKTWMFAPILKFSLDDFLTSIHDLDDDEIREECEDKLKLLVNGVLERRGPSHLDKFQYDSVIDDNYSEASMEWLDQVALLMPQIVSVFIYRDNMLDVPNLIFSCATLQELKLSLYTNDQKTPIRPESINLPSLKVLELRCLDLDGDFAHMLFSGCPALESLYLGFCDLGFSDISSEVLKTLVLEECCQLENMQICCPCLESLNIECFYQEKGISIKNTTCMAKADIALDTHEFDGNLNLLEGLSNVSNLKLDLRCAEFKGKLENNIPFCKNFNNLKSLNIGRWDFCKAENNLVAFFLYHSPSLQKFIVNVTKPLKDDPEEPSLEESVVVLCQREYLETLIIMQWDGLKIIEWKRHDQLLHRVIKNVSAHIKKIGQIFY